MTFFYLGMLLLFLVQERERPAEVYLCAEVMHASLTPSSRFFFGGIGGVCELLKVYTELGIYYLPSILSNRR